MSRRFDMNNPMGWAGPTVPHNRFTSSADTGSTATPAPLAPPPTTAKPAQTAVAAKAKLNSAPAPSVPNLHARYVNEQRTGKTNLSFDEWQRQVIR